MGVLDKFFRQPDHKKPDNQITVQPADRATEPSIISKAIAEREFNLSKAVKIPFADVALTGGSLMQLVPTLKTLATRNRIDNGSLVRVVFPPGVKGKLAKDKDNLHLATILKDGGGLAQARLASVAVDPVVLAAQAAMAAILMEINKKLDNIQETQQKILNFLEQDKQAEQKANLNVLTDILKGYKHNWANTQYLKNHHIKVLDIKQNAEKNIIFYQEQIAAAVKKLPTIYLDQVVKEAIADLGRLFSNYRMALYLLSFAAFLEVLLLGEFCQAYLDQVTAKVQDYIERYQIQFLECRDMIKQYSTKSVETRLMTGIGNAGKALGKFIESVPILSQGPVDEWLQENCDRLMISTDEKAEKAAALFSTEKNTDCDVFVDSIENISLISNQMTDVLFDRKTLYLAVR